MKAFFTNKHFELEAENEEDEKILRQYSAILEKDEADVITEYFEGDDCPSVFSFSMSENPLKEHQEEINKIYSLTFDDFVLPPQQKNELHTEYAQKMENLFYGHTKKLCDFILKNGGDIVSRIWLANTLVIYLPDNEAEIKVINFIKEHGLFVSFRKDEPKKAVGE